MNRKTFLTFLLFFVSAIFSFAQIKIVVDGDSESNVPIYRVAIVSSNASLQQTAQRAFSLHGSYVMVPRNKAQFVFSFENAGANAVKDNNGDYLTTRNIKVEAIKKAVMEKMMLFGSNGRY